MTTVNSTFQIYLVKKFDIDSQQIGNLYSYIGFLGLFVQIFFYNNFAKYLDLAKVMKYGLVVYAFSSLTLLFFTNYYYIFFLLIIPAFARIFLQSSLVSYIKPQNFSPDQGKFYGYCRSIQALGEVFGPFLGGIMIARFIWLPIVFTSAVMIFCLFIVKKIIKQDLCQT
jgi:MFS family permease